MEWQTALALGGVMSMSSTAIVIKLVAERLELKPTGKRQWASRCSRTWRWCRCWC